MIRLIFHDLSPIPGRFLPVVLPVLSPGYLGGARPCAGQQNLGFSEESSVSSFAWLCHSHQPSWVRPRKTSPRGEDSLEVPALPMTLPKEKEQGGRSEVRRWLTSVFLFSSSVFLVPKAPVSSVSCVPCRNTALHTRNNSHCSCTSVRCDWCIHFNETSSRFKLCTEQLDFAAIWVPTRRKEGERINAQTRVSNLVSIKNEVLLYNLISLCFFLCFYSHFVLLPVLPACMQSQCSLWVWRARVLLWKAAKVVTLPA